MKKLLFLILFCGSWLQAQLSQQFKSHWFDGRAEISSYELTQSRYGEQRQGKAVLIFVTEDFLKEAQVKANQKSKTTIPVLKSNRTKSYWTGIYPYSIMSSSFNSLRTKHPLIKGVASIQEWCGQSYLQLNATKEGFSYTSHSYFEGEADQQLTLEMAITEDDLWNLLRFDPQQLPVGEYKLYPSLERVRLNHIEMKTEDVIGELKPGEYVLKTPATGRELRIQFDPAFPYTIEGWTEKFTDKGDDFTSTAKRIHTERRQYWAENNTRFEFLRAPFKLDQE